MCLRKDTMTTENLIKNYLTGAHFSDLIPRWHGRKYDGSQANVVPQKGLRVLHLDQ